MSQASITLPMRLCKQDYEVMLPSNEEEIYNKFNVLIRWSDVNSIKVTC